MIVQEETHHFAMNFGVLLELQPNTTLPYHQIHPTA
jgi:hypothetical protein